MVESIMCPGPDGAEAGGYTCWKGGGGLGGQAGGGRQEAAAGEHGQGQGEEATATQVRKQLDSVISPICVRA